MTMSNLIIINNLVIADHYLNVKLYHNNKNNIILPK